jgi:hypothetical protein
LAIRSMLQRALNARGLEPGHGRLSKRVAKPGPQITVVQRGNDARSAYEALFGKIEYRNRGLEELLELDSS